MSFTVRRVVSRGPIASASTRNVAKGGRTSAEFARWNRAWPGVAPPRVSDRSAMREGGFTLVEIVIAVAIVAATVAAGVGISLGSRSLAVSTAAGEFDQFLDSARTIAREPRRRGPRVHARRVRRRHRGASARRRPERRRPRRRRCRHCTPARRSKKRNRWERRRSRSSCTRTDRSADGRAIASATARRTTSAARRAAHFISSSKRRAEARTATCRAA